MDNTISSYLWAKFMNFGTFVKLHIYHLKFLTSMSGLAWPDHLFPFLFAIAEKEATLSTS